MRFNDTTTRTGLIQDCETLLGMSAGDISGDTTLLKDFTRLINARYRQVNSWIWQASGSWEYDDSNYTDLPVATTDIVDEQQDYELPSTAQKIDRVEIKDTNGEWVTLKAIDKSMVQDALAEFYETPGIPKYYDLVGRSILLYPKPDTAQVGVDDALKVYFSRDIQEFSYTDTSTEPGFVSDYHRLLSLGAALDFAISRNMRDRIPYLREQLEQLKNDLQQFYGFRHRDLKPRIIPSEQSSI